MRICDTIATVLASMTGVLNLAQSVLSEVSLPYYVVLP